MYPINMNEDSITRNLLAIKERLPLELSGETTYRQLSLFDDCSIPYGEVESTRTEADVLRVVQRLEAGTSHC